MSSSASPPPHGFAAVRGRGYRPEQVDAHAVSLSRQRDTAWERAARLTVLTKNMEDQAQHLRHRAARLAPQTYETLGERAQQVFRLAQEEARALTDGAREAAQRLVEGVRERAAAAREAARAHADALRAEAEESARQRLVAAREEADAIRVSARREVKAERTEALEALREMRRRTAAVPDELMAEQARRWEEAEREEKARAAAFSAWQSESAARAEAALAQAKRDLAAAANSVRRLDEMADAKAVELIAEARAREDLVARETERVLREHGATWDDVRAQMDTVRDSLSALTGRAVAE
ncbi:cellulose-binding protein [Streptomyces sp. NPDC090306]|uniref:cellulose-binding protein n=1 Tax=unclassified Streptomyces TaxID=2593676 RepID=UPI0036EFAB0C